MNKWEIDDSSEDENYDNCMLELLNRCEMDDSSDDETDICNNVNKMNTGVTRYWNMLVTEVKKTTMLKIQ